MAFEFKRLPRHWKYLLQRNQVKALLARIDADFRAVQFRGTEHKRSRLTSGIFSPVIVDAHHLDSNWCFRLRVYGLPEEVLLHAPRDIGDLISNDIRIFVSACLGDASRGPGGLTRTFFLREKHGSLEPSFTTARVEGWRKSVAQLNRWWLSAPAA